MARFSPIQVRFSMLKCSMAGGGNGGAKVDHGSGVMVALRAA